MSEHKYAELAGKLRVKIKNGEYKSGERLPSENELAASTGYSRHTVRKAIGILEREGLALRVQGSGTFVQNQIRRHTISHNIAIITTYIGEYIFPSILQGIDHVLSENGYTSLVSATKNRVDNERHILTELLQKPIDGLIVEGTKTALPNPNIDLYDKFAKYNIPVVFINGYYPDLTDPIYVVADDRAGGRIACETLLKKGHKKIAGVFKGDDIQGHYRYAGYTSALHNAGLTVEDDHVLWYTTENKSQLLEFYMSQLIEGYTAVICYNDEVALEVMSILQNLNIKVPDQVEIVSFDNSTYAQISAIPFLSLSNPKEKLGQLAAEKMINMLNGKKEIATVLPWSIEE
ncbi:MAG: substrate-binding domain-containing protein [Clostridiales bacterium]|nr:substrate-binding domain-containing protein [Clostridiales bacterium]